MKLLNERTKFQCMPGNPSITITATENGNKVLHDSRNTVLTVSAQCKVKQPLPCSFLTAQADGTPVNCAIAQTQWMNFDSKVKCSGKSILTKGSCIPCAHGGIITVSQTDCISNMGAVAAVNDIRENIKPTQASNLSNEDNQEISSSSEQAESENQEKSENQVKKEERVFASHTLCDYENCSQREECDYFKSQIYVENNSGQLKANFQKNRSEEWDKYYEKHKSKNLESKNGGWRIAAHHLISGNQVLMMKDSSGNLLYGEIVKLANYFGYDVNNEFNCIMLPTNEKGFGDLENITKHAVPYDVMWSMGRQWHVGGHEYTLDNDTIQNLIKYYKNNPQQYPTPGNPNFFVNYKEAMKEEMNKLLQKYSRCSCWKKNYEAKRKKFFEDMNGVSAKVERFLNNFENNPRTSFPFFVSKISVEYAYDLPATSKMVVIYKSKDGIRAKRIRIERYMKNGLKIVPIEKDDIKISDTKEFILFCENVMHFYIDGKIENYVLPFENESLKDLSIRNVDFNNNDIMKYMFDNCNEIIAFINQNEYTYQPIAKIVSQRGGCQ